MLRAQWACLRLRLFCVRCVVIIMWRHLPAAWPWAQIYATSRPYSSVYISKWETWALCSFSRFTLYRPPPQQLLVCDFHICQQAYENIIVYVNKLGDDNTSTTPVMCTFPESNVVHLNNCTNGLLSYTCTCSCNLFTSHYVTCKYSVCWYDSLINVHL